MNIVTGYRDEAHITSWQDRDLNQGIFGDDTCILNVGSKLAATVITNNEIHIADGVLVMQGCQGVIQKGAYDSLTIDNGTQGMYRADYIAAEYTKDGSGIESLELVVLKGTPSASPAVLGPGWREGDIQNGATLAQEPIYEVRLNGLNIESVTLCRWVKEPDTLNDLATDVSGMASEISEIASQFSGYVITDSFTDTADFAANEYKTVSFDCTKSGHTPLGVVGYATGNHNIYIYGIFLSGNTITVSYKNSANTAYSNRSLRIDVLYVKG